MTEIDPDQVLTSRPRGRFFILLVSLSLYIFVIPPVSDFIHLKFLIDIFFSLFLVSAIYAVSLRPSGFVIAIALALPMLVSVWLAYLVKLPAVTFVAHVFASLFMLYTIVVMLKFILTQQRITLNIIYASIVVYLLMGIAFALLFSLGHDLDPASLDFGELASGDDMVYFSYYSFITLTTLGYGDVTPVARWAVSLSALEAVVGQLYLAVLVARLVGIHTAGAGKPS